MGTDVKEELNNMIRDNQAKYFRIAMSYMKNKDDSLDVLHNAIVKAIQNYPKLRKPKYMDTWFCRILMNECLAFMKDREREVPVEEVISCSESTEPVEEQESKTCLYQAIDQLDGNLKNIVVLRYFNELKIEEIARVTNTNLSTTKSRLYKALSILRKEMEGYLDEE